MWAQAYCARADACVARRSPGSTRRNAPPREDVLRCELLSTDPDVAFDATEVATCPEPDAGDCSAPFGSLCLGPGRAPIGANCFSSEACQSDDCEYSIDPSTGEFSLCGTCVEAPCNGGCPSAQRCNAVADGGPSCVPIGGPGDPCSSALDCEDQYYCGPSATCAPVAQMGEACSNAAAGPPCDVNAYCDATQHCHAYLSASYGADCGLVGNDTYLCIGSGTCDPTDGQCLPPASDGDVCDDSQGLGCLPPARCTLNRCVFPSFAVCGHADCACAVTAPQLVSAKSALARLRSRSFARSRWTSKGFLEEKVWHRRGEVSGARRHGTARKKDHAFDLSRRSGPSRSAS